MERERLRGQCKTPEVARRLYVFDHFGGVWASFDNLHGSFANDSFNLSPRDALGLLLTSIFKEGSVAANLPAVTHAVAPPT